MEILTFDKPVFSSFIVLIHQGLAFLFMIWGFIQDTVFKSSSQDTQNFIFYKPVKICITL